MKKLKAWKKKDFSLNFTIEFFSAMKFCEIYCFGSHWRDFTRWIESLLKKLLKHKKKKVNFEKNNKTSAATVEAQAFYRIDS